MDIISNSSTSVQQRTPTKKTKKPKTKPIKVVYISNPMKVKTSASEFRALVQELTGLHAESPPDPSRFHNSQSFGGGGESCGAHIDSEISVVPPPLDPHPTTINCDGQNGEVTSIESFEPFDEEVFTPQMLENISAMLPSSVFYESSFVDVMQCSYVHP